jgi:hypothetical protein
MKAKDFFPGLALASNQAFFCCLNLAIALQSFEDLPTLLVIDNLFLFSIGSEEGLGLLVYLIFSKFF